MGFIDPVHVFNLFVVFRIERVYFVDANMEDVLVTTVDKMASTMDTPPMMFVGAAL